MAKTCKNEEISKNVKQLLDCCWGWEEIKFGDCGSEEGRTDIARGKGRLVKSCLRGFFILSGARGVKEQPRFRHTHRRYPL